MKREWRITIETTPEGVVRVAADNYDPPGLLTKEEKELLSKTLEPFVSIEDKIALKNLIDSLDHIKDVLSYNNSANYAQEKLLGIIRELSKMVE